MHTWFFFDPLPRFQFLEKITSNKSSPHDTIKVFVAIDLNISIYACK